MGLDWVLEKRKPRKGSEAKFHALREKERALNEQDEPSPKALQALQEQLDAISTRAEDELGAPRIGIDEAATLWWAEHVYAPHFERSLLGVGAPEYIAYWRKPKKTLLKEAHGKYVTALAKVPAGLQSNYSPLVSDLDYGGIGILRHFDFLEDLSTEAWMDHSAPEAARYAAALAEATAKAVRKGDIEAGGTEHNTVQSAVEWLTFWSARGFGFHAWS